MIRPDELQYLNGFGNEFETEAKEGALPIGQFNPQKVAFGLYAEQFSTTAFTMARDKNRRTWFYRIRPSAAQSDYRPFPQGLMRSGPITEVPSPPNLLRWDPLPMPEEPTDFVSSLVTLAANGSVGVQGVGVHVYAANQS
ncbi:MAG: homogentisate 1,2-dioxygenase, partial [Paraglaciecola chathamensis]